MHTIKNITAIVALAALMIGFTATVSAQNGKSMKQEFSTLYAPCGGEAIEITGTYNYVQVSSEVDENGCISSRFHANSMNISGVGTESGAKYRIVDVYNSSSEVNAFVCEGCTLEFTTTSMFQIIGPGGRVYTSQATYHIFVNICTFEFEEIRVHFNDNNGCQD